MNRRDFLKKALIGGVSVVLLPIVTKASLISPLVKEELGGFVVPKDITNDIATLRLNGWADLYGIERKQFETDVNLRERIRLEITTPRPPVREYS